MPPAARITDPTTHGAPLSPGPGSPNVLIGGLPAWRTIIDQHACPAASVSGADGIGSVLMGSPTVFINNQMACRQFDIVVEKPGLAMGPVNPIIMGEPTVMIGEMGIGAPSLLTKLSTVAKTAFFYFFGRSPQPDTGKRFGSRKRMAAARAVFPGQQSYGNCGVESCRQIIKQAKGEAPSEAALLEDSVKKSYADEPPGYGGPRPLKVSSLTDADKDETGGTTPTNRQKILADYGVGSETKATTVDNLATAIKERKGIVANVDVSVFWKPTSQSGGHAITVTDGAFDDNGMLTGVFVNDTGTGDADRYVPINDFMAASNVRPNPTLNITTDPIWPE